MAPHQGALLRNNSMEKKIYHQKTNPCEDLKVEDGKGNFQNSDKRTNASTLTFIRLSILILLCVVYIYSDVIQGHINTTWIWISRQIWFQTVYFETILVIVSSFPIYIPVWLMDWLHVGEKYRIDGKGGKFESETIPELLQHSVGYFLSFGILDTFHVKHYYGVPDDVIDEKRKNWVQTTRALPEKPPMLQDIIVHIVVALIVFDFIFFLLHFSLHKNATLYRLLHKVHHTHSTVNAKVTDRMQPLERIALVLSANAGLKMQGAHPLTRAIFVFVFVFILTDNHSGYDFPYNYDKIIPFGVVSGSRRHYEHHEKGTRYYQPILRYADDFLEWYRKKRR